MMRPRNLHNADASLCRNLVDDNALAVVPRGSAQPNHSVVRSDVVRMAGKMRVKLCKQRRLVRAVEEVVQFVGVRSQIPNLV